MRTALLALALLSAPHVYADVLDCRISASGKSGWFVQVGEGEYGLRDKEDGSAPYLGWLVEGQIYQGPQQNVVSGTIEGFRLISTRGNAIFTAYYNTVRNRAGIIAAVAEGAGCTPALVLTGAAILAPWN